MSKNSPRGLSKSFVADLQDGYLSPLLERVKCDWTLELNIRSNVVHIYYQGGRILFVERKNDGYKFGIDKNYFDEGIPEEMKQEDWPYFVESPHSLDRWLQLIPTFKEALTKSHTIIREKRERISQQQVVVENTYWGGKAGNKTDYVIFDIEYADGRGARFDMAAIKWPRIRGSKNRRENLPYAFIEMKYGDDGIDQPGSSDLFKHITDMDEFLANEENVKSIQDEFVRVFNQKYELGLLDQVPGSIISLDLQNKPEFIILLANWYPRSTKLSRALERIPLMENAVLKFAVSTFMGYGLFETSIYELEEFKERFAEQIHIKR